MRDNSKEDAGKPVCESIFWEERQRDRLLACLEHIKQQRLNIFSFCAKP